MPLLLTFSCFTEIQTGFTFLVPAYPGSPRQRAVKRVCVCVCVCVCNCIARCQMASPGNRHCADCIGIISAHFRFSFPFVSFQLHWLDVPDRILFKLAVTVHQCLNGHAPPYLSEHCIPVSSADMRRHLRSANRHPLAVCRVCGSTLTAVRRSQLLVRWPGTLSRILSGIQRAAQTVLGVYLKRTCSRVTIVRPAH